MQSLPGTTRDSLKELLRESGDCSSILRPERIETSKSRDKLTDSQSKESKTLSMNNGMKFINLNSPTKSTISKWSLLVIMKREEKMFKSN